MPPRFAPLPFVTFLVALLAGCVPSPPFPAESARESWVDDELAQMSLEQKVSQLFAARAYGHYASVDDPAYRKLVDLVERFEIGGLVFFQGDPLSQAALVNDLQQRSERPLLIAQDMEWGPGMRLARTTTFPRTMALGATRDPQYAYAAGWVTAREARALGTHQVYAPVADVNNNPDNPVINTRSFGERPTLVSDMAAAFVRGVRAGGALATVKHFPGHGDTDVDSHADLPVLRMSRARLDTVELVPFRRTIEEGVQSVMVGHLAVPALEPDAGVPASLSPHITEQLLRNQLAFEGLIVTDGLDMRGVTRQFPTGEIAVRAIEAGSDVLILSEDVYAARRAILRAVASGRITERRIDASVRRVLRAKARLNLPEQRLIDLEEIRSRVGIQPHRAASVSAARASLTLLRNEGDVLPLLDPSQRILAVTLNDGADPSAGAYFTSQFRRLKTGHQLTTRLLDRRSDGDDYDAVLREAGRHDILLVATFLRPGATGRSGRPSERRRAFLDALVETGRPVVLVSYGDPYVTLHLERQPAAYVVAYGPSASSQRAAAQAIAGQSAIRGRLPITISDEYPFGAGIGLEQEVLREGFPEEVGMTGRRLAAVDSLMHASIAERAFPGASVAIGRAGVLTHLDGYGYFTYQKRRGVTPTSSFDLASLTKPIATTTAAMILHEEGRLDLDAPVARYLPAFAQQGKATVTIRHLLTHTAGLPPYRPFHREGITDRQAVVDAILTTPLAYTPGTDQVYSDFGMITLGLVIEHITGQELATFARERIFEPLGMEDTGFRPAGATDTTVVPTEFDTAFRRRLVQGEVHDETAWILGGTAGHAGLFSTARDLATFAFMLLNEGRIRGEQFLQPETIRLFTTAVATAVAPDDHTRALGWNTRSREGYSSAGAHFGPNSFGHTGFTGTSLWIDPDQQLFVILLTNRVYPTRDNRQISQVRPQLADAAFLAIQGPPAPLLPRESPYESFSVEDSVPAGELSASPSQ